MKEWDGKILGVGGCWGGGLGKGGSGETRLEFGESS